MFFIGRTLPMTGALAASAIAHWAPRFVANGVALADFEEVTASSTSWNDWCRAWSARAAIREAIGRAALAQGKSLSAGEHLRRAAVSHHFAKFLFVHDAASIRARNRPTLTSSPISRAASQRRPAGTDAGGVPGA
jgi:hypothetical protein